MSGLSRDDENLRNSLLKRQSEPDGHPLTEAEELWLSVLNDRYEKFLEEGLQAMKSQLPSSKGGPSFGQGVKSSVSSFFSKIGKGIQFASLSPDGSPTSDSFAVNGGGGGSGSAVATASADLSAYDLEPPHQSAKHWSWIIKDKLIVGGVPLADPSVTDPSGHIRGVRAQCKERNCKIGLVVSCIDTLGELSRPEDRLDAFAKPKDWEKHLGVSCFAELALPEDQGEIIEVPPSDTLSVCRMINDVMASGKAIYLHCKAGKARCWCIAMCFLITQRGMSFDSAQEWLRRMRPQMSGSAIHALYCQQVADYASANPQPEKGSINTVMNIVSSGVNLSSPVMSPSGGNNGNNTNNQVLTTFTLPSSADDDQDQNEQQQSASSKKNEFINNSSPSNNNSFTAVLQQTPAQSVVTEIGVAGVTKETEMKYKELLADLLQLPAIYKAKILDDLQRLT